MDLVVSTPTIAPSPQQSPALPALRAGDVVEAQVLQAVGDAAKIAIGNTILEVLTQVALTPGATVKLAVSNTPQGLRLTLVGNGANGGNNGVATTAGTTTAGESATSAQPVTGSATAIAAGAGNTVGTGSTANVNVTNEPPATVVTTSAGAAQVAAAGDESAIAGPTAAQAVATGGSTATATNIATTATAAAPQASAQPVAPNPAAAATAALVAAVQSSAARQGGLGPLFADAGVAASLPAVPEPVRAAAERLLALPPALDETLNADSVKQALDRSGLFLEARLSAEANGAPGAEAGSADDLKAALMTLRSVVKSWLASDPAIASALDGAMPGSLPQANALGARNALMALMMGSDGTAANGANAGAQDGAARMAPSAAATTPPPPYRGAPTAGQSAAAPSISADTAPRDIGRVLLNETDAALARQTLLQAASLPDHASAMSATSAMMRNDPTSGPRWLFEVPFPTPQGAAVAQFEIARDGHKAPADGQKVAWRARFSLDVEPIGPVHAQIALTGSRAAVTLWAERPETSSKLRERAPQLADALRQADLETGEVLVRAGTPPRPREAAPAGRFLDRAS